MSKKQKKQVILFIKDIISENKYCNVICIAEVFYVLFLERTLLVNKTLNFNPLNASCSSSTLLLLRATSLN